MYLGESVPYNWPWLKLNIDCDRRAREDTTLLRVIRKAKNGKERTGGFEVGLVRGRVGTAPVIS